MKKWIAVYTKPRHEKTVARELDKKEIESYLPILGKLPLLKHLARRKATIDERRSLVILLTARIVDLRGAEEKKFNPQ